MREKRFRSIIGFFLFEYYLTFLKRFFGVYCEVYCFYFVVKEIKV